MTKQTSVTREDASEAPALLPPVDVLEDQSGITLYADMPGVSKERLEVHVEGDVLVIEGDMALEMPKDMEATHVEVNLPRYRRVFTLSKDLDPERMQAELKQGVLRLHIRKAERARPKRIEVSAA